MDRHNCRIDRTGQPFVRGIWWGWGWGWGLGGGGGGGGWWVVGVELGGVEVGGWVGVGEG